MRNFFIGVCCFYSLTSVAADPVVTPSEIKEVTVFLQGAQVTRTATIRLQPGTNDIRLTDLSPQIHAGSIQVEGNNNFTILSVNHRSNFLGEIEKTQAYIEVEEERDALLFRLRQRKAMETVYVDERNMLLQNQSIKGKKLGLDVEELKEMTEFYRSRMKEIEYKLLEIKTDIQSINEDVNKANAQLHNLKNNRTKNTSEIIISVSANRASSTTLKVSYLVTSAGWVPAYDIRTEEVDAPVNLTYKSQVWQMTGFDWENVKLTLSTGNPQKNNTQPTFSPWVISLQDPVSKDLRRKETSAATGWPYDQPAAGGFEEVEMVAEESMDIDDLELDGRFDMNTVITNMRTTNINTAFDIEIPYTIPSNGKKYDVEIQKHKVPAVYNYFVAPKLDKDAFLLARLTNWDELNLLAGNAYVYYQGTYVGQSYLDTEITNDTLEVSLGRDKAIVVERNKIKDYSKTSTVGSSKKTQLGLEISVRNTKSKSVQITIEDQIPISRRKEIEVKLLEAEGAEYNETTGKLTWKVTLGPNESRTYVFKYEVKYPKDQTIPNL